MQHDRHAIGDADRRHVPQRIVGQPLHRRREHRERRGAGRSAAYSHRGGTRATASVPTMPPAPARLSTMIGWPSAWLIAGASSRAVKSTLPPGGKPTTRRTGRSGKAWAPGRRREAASASGGRAAQDRSAARGHGVASSVVRGAARGEFAFEQRDRPAGAPDLHHALARRARRGSTRPRRRVTRRWRDRPRSTSPSSHRGGDAGADHHRQPDVQRAADEAGFAGFHDHHARCRRRGWRR